MGSFLRCDARRKKSLLQETSAKASTHREMAKIEQAMGDVLLAKVLASDHDRSKEGIPVLLSLL